MTSANIEQSLVMMTLSRPGSKAEYFHFSISTAAYDDLTITDSYRWATQDRISYLPATQYLGPGLTTIALKGIIYTQLNKNSYFLLDKLRNLAGKGEPFLLSAGTGKIQGLYLIESITDQQNFFFSDGLPRKISFTINLKQFGGVVCRQPITVKSQRQATSNYQSDNKRTNSNYKSGESNRKNTLSKQGNKEKSSTGRVGEKPPIGLHGSSSKKPALSRNLFTKKTRG
ncbi:phage tail protein [Endozoicomonas sp. SM1973]|uniref:Phage tail protein n=1 Tax=Spartinivicinus marinus TaxID=2994442 RepID=A0A853I3C0_9GAMM|nr:phage tail protein [Spartinivicinus marinus]